MKFRKAGQVSWLPCSATLVGPTTLLTAAHCANAGDGKGSTLAAHLDYGTRTVEVSCTMSEPYRRKAIATPARDPIDGSDYALCRLSETVEDLAPPRGFELESIDDTSVVTANQAVMLMGYGCTSLTWAGKDPKPGPTDGKLRVADVTIYPPSRGLDRAFLAVLTPLSTGSALCPVDSGGPLISGATLASQDAARRVVGVNAHVLTFDVGGVPHWGSYAAPLATAEFRTFVRGWIVANGNPLVCGINHPAGAWPCHE